MEFKSNAELINPSKQAEVDRDAIMREMRNSLLLLAPEDRDAALRELYQEVENEAETEEHSQQMSQLAMGNDTPAKKTSKKDRESDPEEPETPQKRPRSSAPKKLFSSQNAELMDKAKLDTTITAEMEQDSPRLMSFLIEAEEKEKGDVYLVCYGNRILYIGRTLQLALRFYYHLRKGPIRVYKEKYSDHALTVVKIFQHGTTPVISSLTEALIIYLAEELDLKLTIDLDGEEVELDDNLRNKQKERIPAYLLNKLNDPGQRQIILNGLKYLIRMAMTEGARVTEDDAKEAWKLCKQKRLSDPQIKSNENSKDVQRMAANYADEVYMEQLNDVRRAKYHNNGPGEQWKESIPNLVEPNDIDDRSDDLVGLLREIPEDEFTEAVTNKFTAHKFAARYCLIDNSKKCGKADCRGKDGLPRDMKFKKIGNDCGFVWVCRFTHPISKRTFTHSTDACCDGSILKIDRAGGLYNILHMLYKRAHDKTQAEIFDELGLHDMNDKNGIYKELNRCLNIVTF